MAHATRRLQLGRRVAPTRFIMFAALMVAGTAAAAIPFHLNPTRALLVGFDIASTAFLLSLWPLFDDEAQEMRQRAKDNDANRVGLLAITALVMVVILVAVASELRGKPTPVVIALVIATLTLSWLFSNTVYALHYAHLYYSDCDEDGNDDGGLDFPNDDEPDYWDFVYYGFTLGMTFQTSDVSVTSRRIRRVSIGHSLAAFVFNIGVLAFTINVLGGS